jgi:hypothetical protein
MKDESNQRPACIWFSKSLNYRSQYLAVAVVVLLVFLLASQAIHVQAANATDTAGDASANTAGNANYQQESPVTASASGTLQTVGANVQTAAGSIRVGIYSDDGTGKPLTLLGQSASTPAVSGWNDLTITSPPSIVSGTKYHLVVNTDSGSLRLYYKSSAGEYYYAKTYGPFDATWAGSTTQGFLFNMRMTYSTGPPPSDFTITATTPSQTVRAGATASYTLQITYSASLSATVNLAVTSGCPAGVTCMVSPSSVTGSGPVTLSVPTLVTTPGGTTTVTVTASSTSPALSHSVSVQLTVNSP